MLESLRKVPTHQSQCCQIQGGTGQHYQQGFQVLGARRCVWGMIWFNIYFISCFPPPLYIRYLKVVSFPLPTRFLPGWWGHISSHTLLEDDQIFLHHGEVELARRKAAGTPIGKAYFTPSPAGDSYCIDSRNARLPVLNKQL